MIGQASWEPAPTPETAGPLRDAGFPPWMAAVLARRGIADADAANRFLEPSLDQLHDPARLAGMQAAVARLARAHRDGESVAVVGDYDVDGVSGTALLTAVLKACGLAVTPIIPHRMRDGYGFQPSHAEQAQAAGCRLLVTVDCGTSSGAAAQRALELGIDVVVTDHHLPGSEPLPDEVILINPQQDACSYPFTGLSGAGLAFKLAQATAASFGRSIDPRPLLRIACLGTIADLVPLCDENRVIAAIGLRELERTRSPGLLALIEAARLRPPYSAADVGFRLGPRLNAPGRLDSADKALELLLSRDRTRARALALELDQWNRSRQQEERRVVEQAHELIEAYDTLPPILVLWHSDWHRGVVGIAAGRLARHYNRPAILLALEEDTATGSGRSIEGIDLHGFLSDWDDRLLKFGGHAQAIGMTAARDQLDALRDAWEEAATPWADRLAHKRYAYEIDLTPGQVGPRLIEDMARLEPHGQKNPQPLIRLRGPLELATPPRMFGNGHLSAPIRGSDGGRLRLLGWGWAERKAVFESPFEALGFLEPDRYTGGVQLRLLDCRPMATRGAVDG